MKKVYAVYVTDYVSGLLPPVRCVVVGLYTKLETAIRSMDSFNEVAEKRLISSGVEYEIKRGAFDGEIDRVGFVTKETRKYVFIVEMKVDSEEKDVDGFTIFTV